MKSEQGIINPMNSAATGRLQLLEESQRGIMTSDGFTDVIALSDNLGIEVYQADMPDSQNGYIEYDKDKNDTFIVVNQNHPVTRQRFTVAHELSHFVNDYERLLVEGRLDRVKSMHSNGIEAAADKLAAEILMPEKQTRSFIESLNPDESWSKRIELVADKFKVSRSMAIIRLRELGENVPYIEFA